MSEQKTTNEAAVGGSALTAELESLAWEMFSERYHAAQRRELEIFPGLRAEWEQWKEAWFSGASAEREACAKVCAATMTEAILGGNKEYNTGREMGATVCANKIRMRSNAKVSEGENER